MRYIIIGNIGSDAGYWVLDSTGLHHVGGWAAGRLQEVSAALTIVRQATQLKTPGLAEAAIKSVSEFLTKELQGQLKESGKESTVIIA